MHRPAAMRSLLVLALAGCASVPLAADERAGDPVEVRGHVTSTCGPAEPVALEPVAIRVAGELEVLDSTQTDSSGAFRFHVVPKGQVAAPLFIEARGVRTVAKPAVDLAKRGLVAELVLPCTGG